MYTEIIHLIRNCDHRRVAFAVVTLMLGATSLGLAVPSRAIAADEEAIERLIRDNACPGCDLHEADLRRLDLSGADLTGADLEGANFYYANLDGAQLTDANLIDVNLGYTSARNTVFDGADLRYAIFDHTDLTNASMIATDLRESYINDANFSGAVLDNANMRDTLFHNADFSVASSLCGAITWSGTQYREGCEVAVPPEIDYKF
ncbi:MAG: Pentapeptide repeats (8 copies) [Phormidesmis priestleyi Ana]|uniref:Pentapeptide repeats (8 copies) n=1 Tax=Phormidesmis priestleyi Ana TaxID=1666911 RepID=A0A0P7YTV6_9CYAN|nr:MAG: Pentapeptide repeats (8 copies) [Phormidesmis priestleyi Ana]